MRIECPKFKKPDGTECQIIILLYDVATYGSSLEPNNIFHLDDIFYRPKRKKNGRYLKQELGNKYHGGWRSYSDAEKLINDEMISFVGMEEYKKAMRYAWELIKPKILEGE